MSNLPNNNDRFSAKPSKKIVHTNSTNPTGASREEIMGAPQKKGGAPKKTPAWKVLLTVIIIIASVCIVFSFMWDFFIKDALIGIVDKNLEPSVDASSSYVDDDTGLPVLDGDRREKVFNFLVIGLNDDTGNNTDTMMLINYDVAAGNINVVQIPRDTYIDWTYNFRKINSIFAAGYNTSSAADKAGRRTDGIEELCGFIESNMCVKIDFYVLVDLVAFQNVVDAMGGVEVDVPCDMVYNDNEQNLHLNLRAGKQKLNGYQAMCFCRNRHSWVDQDFGRMDIQKLFISATLNQLKANITDPAVLASLVESAFKNVQTNLTLENCVYFATQVMKTDMSKIRMVTLPTESYDRYIIALKSDMLDVINNFLNVYSEPLTFEALDPKFAFTTTSNAGLHKAYLYDRTNYDIYDASTIEDNVQFHQDPHPLTGDYYNGN